MPTTSEKKKLRALASDIATARGEGHDVIFSARFIAPHFLEGVLVEGKLFKPSESMAYQPYMDHKAYFPSMKGVVLSPSSYSEREKCAIKMLSTICGCECTDNLKKGKNTHVVVPKAEGSKYEAGKKWNKKCVTKEWLEESSRKGYKVDESLFAPLLPGAMLEETQGEETDTTIEEDFMYAGKKKRNPTISRRQWTRRWTMKKKSIIKSCRRRKRLYNTNASNECNENAFRADDRNNEYQEDVFGTLENAFVVSLHAWTVHREENAR